MIAIIDYGVGNLFSLKSSLAAIGAEAVVTRDQQVLDQADHIILPGVGAFGDAANKLRETGMFQVVLDQAASGKPLLGICLGMQLLLERSFEYGEHQGLGLIPGEVRPIRPVIPAELDVPHMGWNELEFRQPHWLQKNLPAHPYVYFVHSYHKTPAATPDVIATADYDGPVPAICGRENVLGMQFHPEKSGPVGAQLLQNVLDYVQKG